MTRYAPGNLGLCVVEVDPEDTIVTDFDGNERPIEGHFATRAEAWLASHKEARWHLARAKAHLAEVEARMVADGVPVPVGLDCA